MADDLGSTEVRYNYLAACDVFNTRVFYAADSRILFSKVVQNSLDLVKCYQVNDPTDDETYDVLDDDGGVIDIRNAGVFKGLVAYQDGVLAVSDKGCWYIKGSTYFSANDIAISKLTSYGITYPDSLITVGNEAFYMNAGGIVGVVLDDLGDVQAGMGTDDTIRSYIIENFSGSETLSDVKAVYDPQVNEVHWYNTSSNKVLIYDVQEKAFYPQELYPTDGMTGFDIIKDIDQSNGYYYAFYEQDSEDISQGTVSLATMTDDSFLDFGENDIEAYLEAGPESLDNFAMSKAITSYTVAFERTESTITGYDSDNSVWEYDAPSGCKLQIIANTSSYSGYATIEREIYKLNRRRWIPTATSYPYDLTDEADDIVYYTDTPRGKGNQLSFKFTAETGKDLRLLGFSVEYSMKGRQR